MSDSGPIPSIHPVNQPEWKGQLSSAAGRGADFALLLALQLGSGVSATKVVSMLPESTSDESFPARLNHYRRSALDCSDTNADGLSQTAAILHSQGVTDARLWQCMHPDPHALVNDKSKLSAEIIANCSFATQQARKSPAPQIVEEDPTQLDDIIKQSEALLAS